VIVLLGGDKSTQAQDSSTALKLARFLSENPMTETKTIPWNTEDHLKTSGDIAAYLETVFEDGDPELISHSLGAVARSKGMTEIAHRTGLSRRSLYKTLSPEGRPEFETVLKVVRALGLKLTVTAAR
jgi:probable addiction module antidote protein